MKQINKPQIYLAGGFRSGWQLEVHRNLLNFELLDPSEHSIEDSKAYTEWDLDAVKKCSIVLAHMESTNPGGYALALEVGYAKALGKKIIFVDQIEDLKVKRYFEMVRQVADKVFPNLNEAINYLNTIS